jgi:Tol biopolymer transport system component
MLAMPAPERGCNHPGMVHGRAVRRASYATVVAVAVSAFVLPARDASAAGWGYTASRQVSTNASGISANGPSGLTPISPLLSTDGRYVVFASAGTNLVAGDLNGHPDVFVKDRASGAVDRVSVSTTGAEADGGSVIGSISGDGRYVAFTSDATNLVPGDTNGVKDVFVRDRVAGITSRLSVNDQGDEADGPSEWPAISADGNWVAFHSDARNLVGGDGPDTDVFVAAVGSRAVEMISVDSAGAAANGQSKLPRISADGRYVVFQSWADNLVPGDTNTWSDVFLRDRTAQITERVAEVANGEFAIGADGENVAFVSGLSNLVPGDTNRADDVFVLNRSTGTVTRVTVDSNGIQADSASRFPSISGDGRFVVFYSGATNLDPVDTDRSYSLFVHDTVTGGTRLVTRRADGTQDPGRVHSFGISADGNIIAVTKEDRHEPPDDVYQVYTWHRDGSLELICIFVNVVMCERQITNWNEPITTRWEINREIVHEYDDHAGVRYACRPGDEVTVRVVVTGKDERPIEATVTSRCVRSAGG